MLTYVTISTPWARFAAGRTYFVSDVAALTTLRLRLFCSFFPSYYSFPLLVRLMALVSLRPGPWSRSSHPLCCRRPWQRAASPGPEQRRRAGVGTGPPPRRFPARRGPGVRRGLRVGSVTPSGAGRVTQVSSSDLKSAGKKRVEQRHVIQT